VPHAIAFEPFYVAGGCSRRFRRGTAALFSSRASGADSRIRAGVRSNCAAGAQAHPAEFFALMLFEDPVSRNLALLQEFKRSRGRADGTSLASSAAEFAAVHFSNFRLKRSPDGYRINRPIAGRL